MSAKSKREREQEIESVEEKAEGMTIKEARRMIHSSVGGVSLLDLSERLDSCRYKLIAFAECFANANPSIDFSFSLEGITGFTYIIQSIEEEIKAVSDDLMKALKE